MTENTTTPAAQPAKKLDTFARMILQKIEASGDKRWELTGFNDRTGGFNLRHKSDPIGTPFDRFDHEKKEYVEHTALPVMTFGWDTPMDGTETVEVMAFSWPRSRKGKIFQPDREISTRIKVGKHTESEAKRIAGVLGRGLIARYMNEWLIQCKKVEEVNTRQRIEQHVVLDLIDALVMDKPEADRPAIDHDDDNFRVKLVDKGSCEVDVSNTRVALHIELDRTQAHQVVKALAPFVMKDQGEGDES